MVLFYSFLLGGTTIPHRHRACPGQRKGKQSESEMGAPAEAQSATRSEGRQRLGKRYIPLEGNLYTFHPKHLYLSRERYITIAKLLPTGRISQRERASQGSVVPWQPSLRNRFSATVFAWMPLHARGIAARPNAF